jgi:transcriptional regulator with XRE-family HTH domain
MKKIRDLREARGESQMQLAAAIGVTTKEVTDWEMGRRLSRRSRGCVPSPSTSGSGTMKSICGRDTHRPSPSA